MTEAEKFGAVKTLEDALDTTLRATERVCSNTCEETSCQRRIHFNSRECCGERARAGRSLTSLRLWFGKPILAPFYCGSH